MSRKKAEEREPMSLVIIYLKLRIECKINNNYRHKIPIKDINQNQNENIAQNNMESVLCLPAIPGHGASPGVWLIDPARLHWRKLIFAFLEGIN